MFKRAIAKDKFLRFEDVSLDEPPGSRLCFLKKQYAISQRTSPTNDFDFEIPSAKSET